MLKKSIFKGSILKVLVALVVIFSFIAMSTPVLAAPPAPKPPAVTVPAGETWIVTETTRLNTLIIAPATSTLPAGAISAPDGFSVTLTVNGVEKGQKLITTEGVDTCFVPGIYHGNIVLTVAEANPIVYDPGGPSGHATLTFPFRQALYLDETGVVGSKSVFATVTGKKPGAKSINNIQINSTGECFNGIFQAGGDYTIANAKIDFKGNGRSDFIGYGAAVTARGTDTTFVLDRADIKTSGVVRAAVIADGGSNVIVKNSSIQASNGIIPEDYIPTIDMTQMRSVPWMLSLSGNCRATNLLGTNTKASYINSSIAAEGWGVLSTDGCITPKLTAINSRIAITGKDGYGSYGIGNATERFLGCQFDVATYATISRGSFLYYGDSTHEAVAQLNTDLGLGLTPRELKSIPVKPTIVNSKRFGIMWHGGGTADISGGTTFNTREGTFLDKGQAITITVDGSKGARLLPKNGIIFQLMDDDDPGPVPPEMYNTGVYTEPTGTPDLDTTHDPYTITDADAIVTFSNIKLKGNLYNGTRGGIVQGPFGPPSSVSRNLGLTLNNSSIIGVVTSSTAIHNQSTITAEDYRELGEVTNTPSAAINNGVIVTLNNGSKWIVTGTCYLTGLNIAADASITAPPGHTVLMNGSPLPGPGTYTGPIVLTIE